MRLFMAIDGACRRNGKPDCTASGGVFIKVLNDEGKVVAYTTRSDYEYGSTNQRGELLALLKALKVVYRMQCEAYIVTDSEYLFNSMTRQWYKNWQSNEWLTRDGYEVKNRDIWTQIATCANMCECSGLEISFYHIKGHCIPFGTVTARKALEEDPTGETLYHLVCDKYDTVATDKADVIRYASELSEKNNGFPLGLDDQLTRDWITANVVADAIATRAVDDADSHRET